MNYKKVVIPALVIIAVLAASIFYVNPTTSVADNSIPKHDIVILDEIPQEPDMTVSELWFSGCNSLVTADEIDAATSWTSDKVQMFTGFYGKVHMNCDYYEYVNGKRKHISIELFPGGIEKFNELKVSKISQNPDKEFSTDVILGVRSFYHKPNFLSFVDKETGIVVWLILDGDVTENDWSDLLAVGQAIENRL